MVYSDKLIRLLNRLFDSQRAIVFVLCAVVSDVVCAQQMQHLKISDQGYEREYYLYVPDSMHHSRPLVIMLHGYGGKAEGYRPEMLKTAMRHGFALCVPQGLPSPKTSKTGWNVRYPKQEGMTVDDFSFIMNLGREVCRVRGLDRKNIFLTGMSNGGEVCYAMAWLYPRFFRAIASVAGLTMAWLPDENRLPKRGVPFMEIHGTQDRTSLWNGDLKGKHGWGAYLPVMDAVELIARMNSNCACTSQPLEKKSAKANDVVLHRYQGGNAETRLYEVVCGKHSWALSDLDTTEEIWKFFEQNMK